MYLHTAAVWFLLLSVNFQYGMSSNVTMLTIQDEIFSGYDKTMPPKFDRVGFDRQVEVGINMYIHSMYAVSEVNMEYSMSIFLRMRWVDERLKFRDVINVSRLELDVSLFDKIWMPDMYILNEKSSHYHDVVVPNMLLHVYPDGTVQFSTKVTGVFTCEMFLQKYPFDTQMCHMDFESYGHSTETLKFVWREDAVTVGEDVKFLHFTLSSFVSYSCEKNYYGIYYPCVGVKFILIRKYAYFVIQIYVPCVLTVILSWVNFWLDCTAVPARITVGLLTVLTMATQTSGNTRNLNEVSCVKAIDVYIAGCLLFVFLALIEFAYVNVLTRVEGRRPDRKDLTGKETGANGTIDAKDSSLSRAKKSPCWNYFQRLSGIGRARLVDKISRVVFPLTFIVFNLVYWCFYFLINWTTQQC